jgi:hypothetical protein
MIDFTQKGLYGRINVSTNKSSENFVDPAGQKPNTLNPDLVK